MSYETELEEQYHAFRNAVKAANKECTKYVIEKPNQPWAYEYRNFWVNAAPYCQKIIHKLENRLPPQIVAANEARLDEAADYAIRDTLLKDNLYDITKILGRITERRFSDISQKLEVRSRNWSRYISDKKTALAQQYDTSEIMYDIPAPPLPDYEEFESDKAVVFDRDKARTQFHAMLNHFKGPELRLLKVMFDHPGEKKIEWAAHMQNHPSVVSRSYEGILERMQILPEVEKLLNEWLLHEPLSALVSQDEIDKRLKACRITSTHSAPCTR